MRAVFHEVFCDAGDQVVGGGFADFDATSELLTSGPDGDGDQSWFVACLGTDTVDVRVLCADFGAPHQQPAGVAATVTDPEGRTLEPSAPETVVAQ